MKSLLCFFILILQIGNTQANSSCSMTKQCMEYEGKIIDLRSKVSQQMDQMTIPESNIPKLNVREFQTLLGDHSPEYFIPISGNRSDLKLLAGALSLGTIIFSSDREVMDFIQDHKTEKTQAATEIGNILGKEALIPLIAGSYFVGAVLDNGKLKQIGLFALAGGLATQIVTEGFKKTFYRTRPNGSEDPYEFFEMGNHSFFSGHTSAAFSMATVVAHVYRDKPFIPYLAYGAAALTSYARMHDKKHWASDVLAGAVAGHLITRILIRTLEQSGDDIAQSSLLVTPFTQEDSHERRYTGLTVTWKPKNKKKKLDCENYGLEGKELIYLCLTEALGDR